MFDYYTSIDIYLLYQYGYLIIILVYQLNPYRFQLLSQSLPTIHSLPLPYSPLFTPTLPSSSILSPLYPISPLSSPFYPLISSFYPSTLSSLPHYPPSLLLPLLPLITPSPPTPSTELFYDRGNNHEFISMLRELARPGDLTCSKSFDFEFNQVEKPFESYTGTNVRLRYCHLPLYIFSL